MKNIKYIFIPVIAMLFVVSACRDESLAPAPDINDPGIIGAVTTDVTVNPDFVFFNALNDLTNERIEISFGIENFGVTEVSSVDIELVFTEKDRIFNPFKNEYEDSTYAAVVVGNVTSFPATFSMTGAEAASALGFASANDLEVGDAFNLTFPINTADGRRLTVALNSDLCNEPAQPSAGGCRFDWTVSCPSDLAGTYSSLANAASTDNCSPDNPVSNLTTTITLTDRGGGQYDISDFSGNVYELFYLDCYGVGTTVGSITDVCADISMFASDAWACANVGSGSVDINTGVITYTWSNCWGDGGDVTLTPM